ncbi:hypothetical protein ONZ45_g16756 [Pleurotus djamor]|nr:hypothetical protein ONZ45_g16756 [Pleurotus djamor]
MYDYYSALEKLTDNAGLKSIPERYKEFIRMFREYRHLIGMKRAGCAHQKSGVLGTENGALSVICPACPIPGVNLPSNWNELSPDKRFLYTLYLALDACFRLKRRDVSSIVKDPGLGIDWAYFAEYEPFRKFVETVKDQKEMSSCSGLAALDHANTKYSQGFAATGVCLGVCARHEIVQRNGAVDLQVGERYVNMDYCLASMLRHHDPRLQKLISYDIACQWSKHLLSRLKTLPPLVRLTIASEAIRFAVPKLHIHGHTKECQSTYSLNYLPGVGRTDGEGIERPWANVGATSTSTRAMGPGARIETLNDHWGHWNWQKVLGLGKLLSRRLQVALSERAIQEESFKAFSAQQGEGISQWKAAVEAYENDTSNPNPYDCAPEGLSEKELRKLLMESDARKAQGDVVPLDDVSPSAFLIDGLNLEEAQRSVAAQKNGSLRNFNLSEARKKLSQSLAHFRSVQAVYMPGTFPLLVQRIVPPGEELEDVPLLLPSSLTAEQRATHCVVDLAPLEYQLRDSQCRSALDSLRNLLFIKSRLLSYKHRHVRHQHANTRARTLITRNEEKIKEQTDKYRAAWKALRSLPSLPSDGEWPELKNEDIRCMDDPDSFDKRHTREALRTEHRHNDAIVVEGNNIQPTVLVAKEAVRIAWVKAWARVRRWTEEVELLKEEMRRVIVTLQFRSRSWEARANASAVDDALHRGLSAYAHRQAHIQKNLANSFEGAWRSGKFTESGADKDEGCLDDDDDDDINDDLSEHADDEDGSEGTGGGWNLAVDAYEEEMCRMLD